MPTTYSTARRSLFAALALGATALSSNFADAHFRLIAPGNWVVQSSDGSPQKTGPCGNEAPQTPSNVVTAFRPGDTVTIQLQETIYHPGHYRVALAVNSPTELPPEPPVTPGSTACGSTVIQTNPTFPILADGMLPHSSPFSGQQSFQVKLPTDVTCTSCTLQIIEFMSDHTAPCFYHHCAKISIQAGTTDGGGASDASRDASGTGGAAGSGAAGGAAGTSVFDGSAGTAGGNAGGSGGQDSGGTAGAGVGGSAGSNTGGSGGAGTAGTTRGTSGTSGQGGSAGSGVETTGCSCSLARTRDTSVWALGAVLAGIVVATRRRRRGRR